MRVRQEPLDLSFRKMVLYSMGCCLVLVSAGMAAEPLRAGVAKVDITNYDAGPVHMPLFARALVVTNGESTWVLVTVDAVSIGGIGHIPDSYLPNVRQRLQENLGLPPTSIMINASHCHGIVSPLVEDQTVQAVQQAYAGLVPVTVGAGTGFEDRISENRRIKLKNGKEADVRHAYSLPADSEVASVGPIDPEIGLIRLNRADGSTLAVVYTFACHPIQGVPGGANTPDLTGVSSHVIEETLEPGTVALFVQGCGGDINPVFYKDVDHPRSAEPLGQRLAFSALKGLRSIEAKSDSRLTVLRETLELPRADQTERIAALEAEQRRLLDSLQGTSLNLKTFLPLLVKYQLDPDHPSYYAHKYLHDEQLGKPEQKHLDAENRRNLEQYIANIHTMEQLTRVQTNLDLLKMHQAQLVAAGKRTVDVEVLGIRLGDAVLITFPGELTVQIGLGIKERSPHELTFVAGYTNGYIYYSPTAEQLLNVGNAQEDSDCILAPEWQAQFEDCVTELLQRL